MRTLGRLLRPGSIAVIGGGGWCEAVIRRCVDGGFEGPVWPVHLSREVVADLPAVRGIEDLPAAPDASFIGVNRNATIDIVRALRARGAGGAVCFASGFKEAADGDGLQKSLLEAAGSMPLLGPNGYGFINALDNAALWPDVHGLKSVERGVAIIGQSSNILLNLTMQRRALPIAYLIAAGNQAQQGVAAIGQELLDDDRVTALGLHVEGFGDIRAFERLATLAEQKGKAIVILKSGRSAAAQQATLSHTASLAGSEAGARALMTRLGFMRAKSLTELLSMLAIAHLHGRRHFKRIASLSCSGGEASLISDTVDGRALTFSPLTDGQKIALKGSLGEKVSLANPLDYHTDVWRDARALQDVYAAMTGPQIDMTCLVLDYPNADRCDGVDWDIAIHALIAAKEKIAAAFALIASLPETMPEDVAERVLDAGIVPLIGLDDAFSSLAATQQAELVPSEPILLGESGDAFVTLTEVEAKIEFSAFGLKVPRSARAVAAKEAATHARTIGFPVVIKGEGAAHKSEAGLVRLDLKTEQDVLEAARDMNTEGYLVEEMIADSIAELLIGVVHDHAHGFVLTIGAGGTLTELINDKASLLVPSSRAAIKDALCQLKLAKLLEGYRHRPAADLAKILDAIEAIQAYVVANEKSVAEVEVNPLLITPKEAIAGDALIVRTT